MEFEGIITQLGKAEEIWDKGFKKLSFVVEEISEREYKSSMSVELFNDKIDLIWDYKVGDSVKLSLNFRAREYNGRWFNSISAWRIEAMGAAPAAKAETAVKDDDLPF